MSKEEIIKDLTLCIDCCYTVENVAIGNILKNIRTSLLNEWSVIDMYYDEIRQALLDEENQFDIGQSTS